MAFTGQLNDLALSELIEFFCNQRKTGRLKVDYALAPGVFFIKDGDLVDAKVGALNGTEAVFFALTLPSASFDFSAGMQSSRRTITESWASVVLEGLRRLDEGIMPDAAQAFASEEEIDEATIEYLNCIKAAKEEAAATEAATNDSRPAADHASPLPLSQTLEATHKGGGKSRLIVAGVAASLVLACVVAAIPLSKRLTRSHAPASSAAAAANAPATTATATASSNVQGGDGGASTTPAAPADVTAEAATTEAATAGAAGEEAARIARREREARLERQRKLLEAKKADAAQEASTEAGAPAAAAAAAKPATGPKSVRVQIAYDEAGRVTQTSVVGSSPGAEAYASTAVRVARGRRFPAGKAGSTVVTIPIN